MRVCDSTHQARARLTSRLAPTPEAEFEHEAPPRRLQKLHQTPWNRLGAGSLPAHECRHACPKRETIVTTETLTHTPPGRAAVLGCRVDRLNMAQTVARCEELIGRREVSQHVAINAAKLVAMQRDPELRRIVEACELVSADGQAVVWASRLLGDPLPERVAGIDLMHELFGLAERRGYRVFILGAKAKVLAQAREKLLAQYPRLELVGARDGYFSQEEEAEVAEEVRTARPDILFVAFSSPRKEYWLGRYGRTIDVPFVMGVGGAIDVVAGVTQRAPRLLQRLGLEWAYRLAQEPRRLWRRYAVTNAQFTWLIARAVIDRSRRRVRL